MNQADILFVNCRVLTIDNRSRIAQAVAIKGDRLLAIGTVTELRKLAGRKTKVFDLRRRTLLPGFVDAHAHQDREGLKYLYLSLAGARSIADITNSHTPGGEAAETWGMDYNHASRPTPFLL
jgi:hypothetical protein